MSTNAYVNTNIAAGKIGAAAHISGSLVRKMVQTYEKVAGDTDAGILRFFKGLSPDVIISNLLYCGDALAGMTSVKAGFYGVLDWDNVGAIVGSGNQLATAVDLHSAVASGSETSLMSNVDVADRGKRIYELCGHTQLTKLPAYDLCLTLTTGGVAAGTMTLICEYVQG